MTNDEAIAYFKRHIDLYCVDGICREAEETAIKALEQQPCDDAISRNAVYSILNEHHIDEDRIKSDMDERQNLTVNSIASDVSLLPSVTQKSGKWIPVSERLPELNRPLLVTSYHRVYYGYLISESGNYGYPVFRIHGLGDKNRDWVQETMSHEPYSLGRIDAWMYLDIPEPYKVESEVKE